MFKVYTFYTTDWSLEVPLQIFFSTVLPPSLSMMAVISKNSNSMICQLNDIEVLFLYANMYIYIFW